MQRKGILTASSANLAPIGALLAATASVYGAYNAMGQSPANATAIIGRLLIASVSLLGFTVTGLSIMVAVGGRDLGKQMRRSGHYQSLIRDAVSSARLLFTALVIGLAALFAGSLVAYPGAAMAGCLAAGLVYLAVAGNHFFQVLRFL